MLRWVESAHAPPLNLRVCYEDAPASAGIVGAIATPTSVGDPVAGVVAALRSTDYPLRFRVVELQGRQVIAPDEARTSDTHEWRIYPALLDTPITLDPGLRSVNEALGLWGRAVEEHTGERIRVPQEHFSDEKKTDAAGSRPARDLLVEILDDASDNYGPNLIWHLIWVGDPGAYAIYFDRVWGLEGSSGTVPRPSFDHTVPPSPAQLQAFEDFFRPPASNNGEGSTPSP
jgi:hypothetical protein